ncbi:hypothetical protein HAX54_042145 [Datura stramonium]|uniref:Uncharacterized protein n=1 Tax=Datura stramonium TaxID=4076 RepID=A0ABS8W2Q6_DATST|nr:hypothetical protein [Datura stramonium]
MNLWLRCYDEHFEGSKTTKMLDYMVRRFVILMRDVRPSGPERGTPYDSNRCDQTLKEVCRYERLVPEAHARHITDDMIEFKIGFCGQFTVTTGQLSGLACTATEMKGQIGRLNEVVVGEVCLGVAVIQQHFCILPQERSQELNDGGERCDWESNRRDLGAQGYCLVGTAATDNPPWQWDHYSGLTCTAIEMKGQIGRLNEVVAGEVRLGVAVILRQLLHSSAVKL